MIDEKRAKTLYHRQSYHKRVAKSFNRKVRPRHFEINDIVLRKVIPIILDPCRKFTPNYEGPYIVTKVLPGGVLNLIEMDGQELPRPINADATFGLNLSHFKIFASCISCIHIASTCSFCRIYEEDSIYP